MSDYDDILKRLNNSNFRSSFHLGKKYQNYVSDKGMEVIKKHAYDFINSRLKPANPLNDGKQTPMKNHPVFIAQHATATCCRGCLEKWHKIPKNRTLSCSEVDYIIGLILAWIKTELEKR